MTQAQKPNVADHLEGLAAEFLKRQVQLQLNALEVEVSSKLDGNRSHANAIIKLALFMYNTRNSDPKENLLRFRGQATRVFTTWVFDRLPVEALKNLAKYDGVIYARVIELRFSEVDVSPYLQPPADYQAP